MGSTINAHINKALNWIANSSVRRILGYFLHTKLTLFIVPQLREQQHMLFSSYAIEI